MDMPYRPFIAAMRDVARDPLGRVPLRLRAGGSTTALQIQRAYLTRIESRPARRGMGTYIFFIDIAASPGWQDALEELSGIARVRNLGCYPEGEVYG